MARADWWPQRDFYLVLDPDLAHCTCGREHLQDNTNTDAVPSVDSHSAAHACVLWFDYVGHCGHTPASQNAQITTNNSTHSLRTPWSCPSPHIAVG